MSKQKNFEKSLAALESIVQKMEKGELNLETALKQYEEGMSLAKHCQAALTQAQQRIKLIAENNGEITENLFNNEDPI